MHPGLWWLLAALAAQRAAELATAARNTRRLLARGARLVADDGYGLLVAAHAAFFLLAAAEALGSPWAGTGWWTPVGLALLLAGELLRGWAILTLGPRWTTRVVVLPRAPLEAGGPYRLLRHPNYAGVVLSLAGLPLAFGLWATLAGVGLLNAVALARRVRREEAALAQAAVG